MSEGSRRSSMSMMAWLVRSGREGDREEGLGEGGEKGDRRGVDVPDAMLCIFDALHGDSLDEGLEDRQEVFQKRRILRH